ncbi:Uncharacterised protein [Candidatus Burarchaeum australiense]|nr:Uncharacterised protein [Candidatus Burarchaeum australiense]
MFIVIVVLLGTLAWVFQNNVREAKLLSKEAAVNEVRSNRLSVLRNVIEKSYVLVEPRNRGTWRAAIEQKLAPKYDIEFAMNTANPPYCVLEDRTYGMSASFFLPSGRSG